MLRMLVGGFVALALVVGLALTAEAAKGKKGKGAPHGKVVSVKGTTLTLEVGKKGDKTSKEFDISKAKVLDAEGNEIKSADVATALQGKHVHLKVSDDGAVTEVKVGKGKKKKKSE